MSAPYHLFEVRGEVVTGDREGAPVLERASAAAALFGDRYLLVTPEGDAGELDVESGFEGFEEGCREEGVGVRVVRRRVSGRPRGLLIDASGLGARRDAILAHLWRRRGVDSLFASRDDVQAILFGHAAGVAVARWWEEAAARHPGPAVLEAHGAHAGVALLVVVERAPDVGTVFVATAGDATAEWTAGGEEGAVPAAAPHGPSAEPGIEAACAAVADVLAVTSSAAAEACAKAFGRAADAVLPPGIDAAAAATRSDPARVAAARAALAKAAGALSGPEPANVVRVLVAAGSDPADEGVATALAGLALLRRRGGVSVTAFVAVPPSAKDALARRCADLGLAAAGPVRAVVVGASGEESQGLSRDALRCGVDLALHLSPKDAATGPLESTALGVPVVVSSRSTWGSHAEDVPGPAPAPVTSIDARVDRGDRALEVAAVIEGFAAGPRDREVAAARCRATARERAWDRLLPRHDAAWRAALTKALARRDARPRRASRPLPASLAGLTRLARDFAWTWDPDAPAIFETLSPRAWRAARHAPLEALRLVAEAGLPAVASDRRFLERIERAVARLDAPGAPGASGSSRPAGSAPGKAPAGPVAYLCAEFGVHESLPVYGGGLGILAGDHLKSASDLGVPVVGVGLYYRRGRQRQRIGASGEQRLLATTTEPEELALTEAVGPDGRPVRVEVPVAGATVVLRAWRAAVGRTELYLLDPDVPENAPTERAIANVLYPSDPEARIRQEAVLGRGGIRLLAALGCRPAALHLNEGHPAFAALERVVAAVRGKTPFPAAREAVMETTTFTTHTPVPAGHDRFDPALVTATLADVPAALGVSAEHVLALGRDERDGRFNMTRLAISLSGRVNAVSRLHRDVSRRLLAPAWPDFAPEDVPVDGVTNGVHLPTWTHPAVAAALGAVDRAPRAEDFTKGASRLSPADLWAARAAARRALLERVRHGLERAFVAGALSTAAFDRASAGLTDRALLVGFARRFAAYKRAHLLLSDVARLERIVSNADRPVRVFFAGKAHPDDREGRGILRRVAQAARSPALEGKVFLLEDYGIASARVLAQGVDVWLNTPLRGLEASGTSGMKVAANGGLNLSVPDGWWPEAFDGTNGWSIGAPAALDGGPGQDEADAASVYDLLEREVVPLFFDRDAAGIPVAWCAKALRSLSGIPPVFNSDRMLREYAAASYSR